MANLQLVTHQSQLNFAPAINTYFASLDRKRQTEKDRLQRKKDTEIRNIWEKSIDPRTGRPDLSMAKQRLYASGNIDEANKVSGLQAKQLTLDNAIETRRMNGQKAFQAQETKIADQVYRLNSKGQVQTKDFLIDKTMNRLAPAYASMGMNISNMDPATFEKLLLSKRSDKSIDREMKSNFDSNALKKFAPKIETGKDGNLYSISRDTSGKPIATLIKTADSGTPMQKFYKKEIKEVEGGRIVEYDQVSETWKDSGLKSINAYKEGLSKAKLGIDQAQLSMSQEKAQREGKRFDRAEHKKDMATENAIRDLNSYAELAEGLSENGDLDRATGAWTYLPTFRGGKTADIEAGLTTLKAKAGLAALTKMKEASSTGASGMGALSERELDVLIDAYTTIQSTQSTQAVRKNLKHIVKTTRNLIKLMKTENEGRSWRYHTQGQETGVPKTKMSEEKKERLKYLRRKKAGLINAN